MTSIALPHHFPAPQWGAKHVQEGATGGRVRNIHLRLAMGQGQVRNLVPPFPEFTQEAAAND